MDTTLGQKLRTLRNERGETLQQVADTVGVSVALMSRIENGHRSPNPRTLNALAAHFGMPADELFAAALEDQARGRWGDASAGAALRHMSSGRDRTLDAWYEDEPTTREAPERRTYASMGAPMSAPSPAPAPKRGAYRERPIDDLFDEQTVEEAREIATIASVSARRAARHGLRGTDRDQALATIRALTQLAEGPIAELERAAREHPDPAVRAHAEQALRDLRGIR